MSTDICKAIENQENASGNSSTIYYRKQYLLTNLLYNFTIYIFCLTGLTDPTDPILLTLLEFCL